MKHVSELLPAVIVPGHMEELLKRERIMRGFAEVLLKALIPEPPIPKPTARRIEGVEMIRTNREEQQQNVATTSRPFVLCGLPIRKPPKSVLIHKRRNGKYRLDITGHPEYGLPYGQDRLIPIFLATLARQQGPVLRFKSAAEMLTMFGLAHGGKEYRRLLAGLQRIFGSTIFFGTDSEKRTANIFTSERFHFLAKVQLWFMKDTAQQALPGEEFQNTIVLSDDFYREIMQHPIKLDLDVMRTFAGAPAVLDLFCWLSYRCYTAKEEEEIPLFGDFGLASQLGNSGYTGTAQDRTQGQRDFRKKLNRWFKVIRAAWPECPAKITEDGLHLRIAHVEAIKPRSNPPALWIDQSHTGL